MNSLGLTSSHVMCLCPPSSLYVGFFISGLLDLLRTSPTTYGVPST